MSIVLFAIIGATIKAGTWYWICYGLHVVARVLRWYSEVINDD